MSDSPSKTKRKGNTKDKPGGGYLAPSIGIGVSRSDIRRDGRLGKHKNANALRPPIHGIHASALSPERRAIRAIWTICVSATSSSSLTSSIVVAVGRHDGTCLGLSADLAIGRRMESIVVDDLVVDALQDIDFASVWPLCQIGCPERGPAAADTTMSN